LAHGRADDQSKRYAPGLAAASSAECPDGRAALQLVAQPGRTFSIITGMAIRRGSFTPVTELVAKIDHFVAHCNKNCKPFNWTATADSFLAKIDRLCERISGTGL
jgi:hypothetical protein